MNSRADLTGDVELSPVWRMPYPGDPGISVIVRRNLVIAIVVSLLVHLIVVLTLRQLPSKQGDQGGARQLPFSLELNPKASQKNSAQSTPTPAPPTPETEEQKAAPTKPVPRTQPLPIKHPLTTTAPNAPFSAPSPEPTPVQAEPELPPAPPVSDPGDMGEAVRARRAQREAAIHGDDYVPGGGPTADQRRDEIIKRNLQRPGTNGIFEIRCMSRYEASFIFNGWTSSMGNTHHEVLEVQSNGSDDIQRAVVRKMIAVIRQYYTGEFNWELRSGRVQPMSARPQDNAQLEAFLMHEIFDGQTFPQCR